VTMTTEVMGVLHGNLDSTVVTIVNSYMHNIESISSSYHLHK
jgi:hypothetical protein